MQHGIQILLLAGAIVFFLLASFRVTAAVDWIPLGYACVTGAVLVGLL